MPAMGVVAPPRNDTDLIKCDVFLKNGQFDYILLTKSIIYFVEYFSLNCTFYHEYFVKSELSLNCLLSNCLEQRWALH